MVKELPITGSEPFFGRTMPLVQLNLAVGTQLTCCGRDMVLVNVWRPTVFRSEGQQTFLPRSYTTVLDGFHLEIWPIAMATQVEGVCSNGEGQYLCCLIFSLVIRWSNSLFYYLLPTRVNVSSSSYKSGLGFKSGSGHFHCLPSLVSLAYSIPDVLGEKGG